MSNLISGKEALIALANGGNVEFEIPSLNKWACMKSEPWDLDIVIGDKYNHKFRIKPKTIMLGNIEVPAPFEPKEGEECWVLSETVKYKDGYKLILRHEGVNNYNFGAWRTEEEIKQVVEALRGAFR